MTDRSAASPSRMRPPTCSASTRPSHAQRRIVEADTPSARPASTGVIGGGELGPWRRLTISVHIVRIERLARTLFESAVGAQAMRLSTVAAPSKEELIDVTTADVRTATEGQKHIR
jgi:hypothetical protein